jgi:hypothetical protein
VLDCTIIYILLISYYPWWCQEKWRKDKLFRIIPYVVWWKNPEVGHFLFETLFLIHNPWFVHPDVTSRIYPTPGKKDFKQPRPSAAVHQLQSISCSPSAAVQQLQSISCSPSAAVHQLQSISCSPSAAVRFRREDHQISLAWKILRSLRDLWLAWASIIKRSCNSRTRSSRSS